MYKKWLILAIIILMYLPISLDATMLHVASPWISTALSATSNELLWIIDIYSLVMAGLLLPMGALGDKIGYKRLAIHGLFWFALASLAAALSKSALQLILSRIALAVGASMLLPATLSAVRKTFANDKQRSIALGIWTAISTIGAAFGPLIGGYLLTRYYWGSVFLINILIIAVVLPATWLFIPQQPKKILNSWPFYESFIFLTSILLLVLSIKNGLRNGGWSPIFIGLSGLSLLIFFIYHQLKSPDPILDVSLFKERILTSGVILALITLMTLVGLELLVTQELQFIYKKTPLQVGLFMLPMMLSASICGPIVGWLVPILELRTLASSGIAICSISFFGLSQINFIEQITIAWGWMTLLGFSVQASLLVSTTAIMSVVPSKKSGAAGAIEGMAYELGTGLGIVIFGMMLINGYTSNVILPPSIPDFMVAQASSSISEAMQVAEKLDSNIANLLQQQAKIAFVQVHKQVLITGSIFLGILTILFWYLTPNQNIRTS